MRFSGVLTLAGLGDLPARLDALGPVDTLDLSAIERIDIVVAWIVTRTARRHGADIVCASEEAQRMLGAMAGDRSEYRLHGDQHPAWDRALDQVGTASVAIWRELLGIVFLRDDHRSGVQLRARRRLRWNALVAPFQTVGIDALPIMSFLIGIVHSAATGRAAASLRPSWWGRFFSFRRVPTGREAVCSRPANLC